MAGTSRIYFSRNGVELVDHPANGMTFSGLGCSIANIGRTMCRRSVWVDNGLRGDRFQSYIVNEEDFDGPVMVNTWHSAREYNESFALCELQTAIDKGGIPTGHKDTIGRDGRGVEFQGHAPFSEYAEAVNS